MDSARVAQVIELYNFNPFCTDTAYVKAARKRIAKDISPGLVFNTVSDQRSKEKVWKRDGRRLYMVHAVTGEKQTLNRRFLVRKDEEEAMRSAIRQHDPVVQEAKVFVLDTDVTTNGDGTIHIALTCKLA
jgi:hypothetical protein